MRLRRLRTPPSAPALRIAVDRCSAIAWRGPLVAWANDAGVKVYDMERDERVCYVEVPRPPPPSAAAATAPAASGGGGGGGGGRGAPDPYLTLLPVRLCWETDASLLIGWGTEVRVVTIREKPVAGPGGTATAVAGAAAASGVAPVPPGAASAHGGAPGAPQHHAPGGPTGGPMSPPAAPGMLPALHVGGGGPDAGPPPPVAAVRRAGEITLRHSTGDAFVVGVAPYGDDHIALLWCVAATEHARS